MMGKQIRFYTFPKDETNLVDFILSLPGVYFIKTRTKLPIIESVGRNSIINSTDPGLRLLFIGMKSIPIPEGDNVEIRATTFNKDSMDFIETGEIFYSLSSNSPVIEFSRSFIREDNKLVQGRIWCNFYRLADNQLIFKGEDFSSLYGTLSTWIKKNFKKIKGADGYFGSEAREWYKMGGSIFP